MHIFPLSPEQDRLASFVAHKPLSFVRYLDEDFKYNSIAKMVFSNLWNLKSTVIITSNAEQLEHYMRLFAKMNISDLVLNAYGNKQIDSSNISRLRAEYKGLESKVNVEQLQRLQITDQNRIAKTQEILAGLNAKVLGANSWTRLREQLYILQESNPVEPILNSVSIAGMELDQEEYYALRSQISKAQQYFESEYNHIKHLDLISKDSFTEYSLIKLYELIEKATDEMGDICFRLNLEIVNIETQLKHELDSLYLSINELLEQVQIELQVLKSFTQAPIENKKSWFGLAKKELPAINPVFTFFNKELKRIKSELAHIGMDQVCNISSIDQQADLSSFRDILLHISNQWEVVSTDLINHRLKRYNVNNVPSEELESLDEHFSEVLAKLEERKLLKEAYENTSNNLLTKRESANRILAELKKTCYLINTYPDYIEWCRFFFNTDTKIQEVLQKLFDVPKNLWMQHYDQWYFENCLNHKKPKNLYQLNALLHDPHTNIDMYNESLNEIDHKWRYRKTERIEHLKNTNQGLFSDLFKKNIIVNQTYTDLILADDYFLTTMFPIVILDADAYAELRYKKSSMTHTLIIEDPEEMRDLDLLHIEQIAEHTNIYCAYSQNLNSHTHLGPFSNDSNTFLLEGCTSVINSTLQRMSSNDRLIACKKLSKQLFSFHTKPRVFQSKEASLISFASEYQLEKFLKLKKWTGIREQSDEQMTHKVTEALLAIEKQQYILIQDGILSVADASHYRWQQQVLEQLSDAGIEVVNYWTEVLEEAKLYVTEKIVTNTESEALQELE